MEPSRPFAQMVNSFPGEILSTEAPLLLKQLVDWWWKLVVRSPISQYIVAMIYGHYIYILVSGLEHEFYFSIYWE